MGRTFFLALGKYNPASAEGQGLLSHELTHVLQQRSVQGVQPAQPKMIQCKWDTYYIEAMNKKPTDYYEAAWHLNGAQSWEIRAVLKNLSPAIKAKLHRAARYGQGLGPCSNIALFTEAEYLKLTPGEKPTSLLSCGTGVTPTSPLPTGENVAAATENFPAGIEFIGVFTKGSGIRLNPEYWIVEYALKRENDERTFNNTGSPANSKVKAFFKEHPDWHNPDIKIYIRIRIGDKGAAGAINNVWNSDSTKHYAIDCYVAAALIQLKGVHDSYAQVSAVRKFDRDYNDFHIDLKPFRVSTTLLPPSGLFPEERKTPAPIEKLGGEREPLLMTETDYSKKLNRGDWVVIRNPYAGGAWAGENAIYKGEGHFFGFPIGDFTVDSYAEWMVKNINGGKVQPLDEREFNKCKRQYIDKIVCGLPENKREVLERSYIIPLSRPMRSIVPER